MEKAGNKFVVESNTNPRGSIIIDNYIYITKTIEEFSLEDIKQWVLDIKTWLSKNLKTKSESIPGATEAELLNLQKKLIYLPDSLQELLKTQNGQIQLLDSFKGLSAQGIIDACEEYKIYGYWNNNYIPIAKDLDGSLLIIEVDKEKKTEKGVVVWNRDNGVLEEINENFGLYLESYCTGLLKKKYEYIEGVGIIENSN